MDEEKIIEGLMDKPLFQMNGREFCALLRHALSFDEPVSVKSSSAVPVTTCNGIFRLKYYLDISEARLRELYREGVLDDAVLYRSKSGRICTFDVEKAGDLVRTYLLESNKKTSV